MSPSAQHLLFLFIPSSPADFFSESPICLLYSIILEMQQRADRAICSRSFCVEHDKWEKIQFKLQPHSPSPELHFPLCPITTFFLTGFSGWMQYVLKTVCHRVSGGQHTISQMFVEEVKATAERDSSFVSFVSFNLSDPVLPLSERDCGGFICLH